jgi:hypothetical protein
MAVERQLIRFNFKGSTKKDKEGNIEKDEKGNPIKIPAQPPLDLMIPQFTQPADLIEIANSGDEKQVKLAIETLNAVFFNQTKKQLDEAIEEGVEVWDTLEEYEEEENGKKVKKYKIIKAGDLSWINYDQLDWGYISSIPPSKRGAVGFTDEIWEGFLTSYQEIMVKNGKKPEQSETGAKILRRKFAPIKNVKIMLNGMKNNLEVWAAQTTDENRETYADLYTNLMEKLQELLATKEEALAMAI